MREDRQARVERDRLAEARSSSRRRSATAQSAPSRSASARACARGFDRHVHHAPAKTPAARSPSSAATRSACVALPGRRQHQRAPRAEPFDLGPELLQRAGAEDDAAWIRLVGEGMHVADSSTSVRNIARSAKNKEDAR